MREVTQQQFINFLNSKASCQNPAQKNIVENMVEYVINDVVIAARSEDVYFIEDDIDSAANSGNIFDTRKGRSG